MNVPETCRKHDAKDKKKKNENKAIKKCLPYNKNKSVCLLYLFQGCQMKIIKYKYKKCKHKYKDNKERN